MTTTVRSSRLDANSTSTVVVALPDGTSAGDRLLLFVFAGTAPTSLPGWTQLSLLTGDEASGAVWSKVADDDDIATGDVTVTFASAAPSRVVIAATRGSAAPSLVEDGRDGTPGTPPTLTGYDEPFTVSASPGGMLLYFAGARNGAAAIGCDRGETHLEDTSADPAALFTEPVDTALAAEPGVLSIPDRTGHYHAVVYLPQAPNAGDPANEENAVIFTTGGYVTQNPAVVEPPASLQRGHAKLKALAYTAPTVTNGRTILEPDIAQVDAARDRIIVGGRDVTYFRGAPTPFPGFRLTQPLGYGATTLVFPQTHAAFETPGQGGLKWLAKEKNVRIERIDPDTKQRVGLDYRGVITALRVQQVSLDGGESKLCWVADVGGAASGRAALMEEQPPLFRRVRDVSRHVYWQMFQMRQRLPLPPDTGIEIERQGGLSSLDWLHHLCAISTRKNGNQFTLMPDETNPVKWTWALKRKVRRDATVYFDSGMVVPDLVDDLAEQPNMIYGTGVTPEGMKVKNGSYPGLIQAKAPAYPFADGRTFGMGDDLSDAREGSIQAMNWRLLGAGYMSARAAEQVEDREMGKFTQETADAIDMLLEDGGDVPQNGRMNPLRWAMLFDLSVTGYSLRQTSVRPMAQAGYTRAWNRTASGAKASRNPDFRPHRLKVHRTIDFGSGHRKQRMMQWARHELRQAQDGQNWVGTITVNTGALVRGDHTPGTPLTAADVMPFRDLRPGMNVWAPLFDGGTLFHIAGIDVSDDGRTGTLTVDTKFRDLMSVAEIVARNRESRRDPARAWHREHRKSKLTWDTIVPFDEVGGRIWQPIDAPAYEWTVFPVVAGQEGTIAKLRLDTTQGPAEFCMTVWGRKPFKKNLDKYLSDPMALDEDGRSVWDEDRVMFKNRILLYAAGTDEEPCGYWPRRHTGRNGGTTLAPITGRWVDDASFSYHTFSHPVLWVAIWPKQGTLIPPQRILWPQLEVGG